MLFGKNVVFIHVPKCGGTSVGQALRLRYALSQTTIRLAATRAATEALHPGMAPLERMEREYRLREAVLLYLLGKGVRCIGAHVRFSEAAHRGFGDRYAFVTVLRDPVERFVSHYRYVRRHHPEAGLAGDLETFLDTPDALRFGSQYLYYLVGRYQFQTDDLEASTAAACANVRKFDLVGDLADLPAFVRGLSGLLGVRLFVGHRNRAPKEAAEPLDPALRERIAAICAPDLRIYAAARAGHPSTAPVTAVPSPVDPS